MFPSTDKTNPPHLMCKCTPTINDVLLRHTVAYLQQSNQIITIKLLCDELGADRKTVYRRVSSAVALLLSKMRLQKR